MAETESEAGVKAGKTYEAEDVPSVNQGAEFLQIGDGGRAWTATPLHYGVSAYTLQGSPWNMLGGSVYKHTGHVRPIPVYRCEPPWPSPCWQDRAVKNRKLPKIECVTFCHARRRHIAAVRISVRARRHVQRFQMITAPVAWHVWENAPPSSALLPKR